MKKLLVCTLCLVHSTSGALLRHSRSKASGTPVVNATAELEVAVAAILTGRSPQGEYSRLPETGRAEAETHGATLAAAQLGLSGAGHDLEGIASAWAVRTSMQGSGAQAIHAGSSMDEASIKRAVGALSGMMGQVAQQVDEHVISCTSIREKNAQWRDQLELDLVGASDELAQITGLRTDAVTGMQAADTALAKLGVGWQEEQRAFNKTMARIADAEKLQQDDVAKLREMASLTKCAGAASFLSSDIEPASPHDFWTCRSNKSGSLSLLSGHTEVVSAANRENTLRESLVDIARSVSTPHELQHLKCSFGRLGCAPVHLAAVRLLAETTDALDDLADQAKEATQYKQKFRSDFVKQQEDLRVHKMQLSQELAEAVSRMASVNELRRSLSQDVRTHLRESRAHQAQCKTTVRTLFETMCGLRKIRSFLAAKSDSIKLDDVADCDVTDWQMGECSASCDNACPGNKPNGKPCGGEMTVTREIIQSPGSQGMKCPTRSKVAVCNQVKCPIDCKVSGWSSWASCSRECGGGISSRTRKVLQLPQHGGEVCGPAVEARPCNSGMCGICPMKPWGNWSQCSAVCGGGMQVRSREPKDALSLLEASKLKCPDASSPHRYQEQACMTQKCDGDEQCVEEQDLIFALDGSASLSKSGFEALRGFAAALAGKYQSPNNIAVVQFGNGDLLADGTITPALQTGFNMGNQMAVATIDSLRLLGSLPNIAQALAQAETMFRSGRDGVQKSLVLLTNSKPLYKHKAFEQAARLHQQGVRVVVVTAADSLEDGPFWDKPDHFDIIRKIASAPVEANLFHIEALSGPKADPLSHVPAVLARACRKAQKPS